MKQIGIINATVDQLSEIGITEDINGKQVEVYDIDKYRGERNLCSRIVVDSKFYWLGEKGLNVDYIIPTSWIVFNN
jgi:hypothetical protein